MKLRKIIYFPAVYLLKKSKNLSALACRLTRLTGKSKYPLHPKHLIDIGQPWYLKEINKKDIVLDLGCGAGHHCWRIAGICRRVIGVDYNKNQLQLARKIAQVKNFYNINFIHFNLEKKLPFSDMLFDKILCLDVLEHLHKRKEFLQEIKRVLKAGGTVYLSVPNKNTSWKELQRQYGLNYFTDPDHKIEYTLTQIVKSLRKLNFRVLNVEPVVYDTPWAGFIDLTGGISLKIYRRLMLWKINKVKTNLKETIGFRIKVVKQ